MGRKEDRGGGGRREGRVRCQPGECGSVKRKDRERWRWDGGGRRWEGGGRRWEGGGRTQKRDRETVTKTEESGRRRKKNR